MDRRGRWENERRRTTNVTSTEMAMGGTRCMRARATPATRCRSVRREERGAARGKRAVRVAAAEGGAQEAAQEKKAAPEAAPKAAAPAAAPKPAPKKKAPATAFKSGEIVRVIKEKYVGSLEALANQSTNYTGVDYIFENRGEVLEVKVFKAGEYALVSVERAMATNEEMSGCRPR